MLNRLPTMWETRVQSLSQEDPLEKEMATHSSILAGNPSIFDVQDSPTYNSVTPFPKIFHDFS